LKRFIDMATCRSARRNGSCFALTALVLTLAACATPQPLAPTSAAQTPLAATAVTPAESAPAAVTAPADAAPAAEAPPTALDLARPDYEKAVAALRDGHDQEAEKLFAALAEQHPELAGPHTNLGIIYYQRGEWATAEQSFKRAIERHPQDAVAHNYLGMLYRQQGHFKEARAAYQQALTLQPEYAYAHLNLAMLCDLYLGDLATAEEHYRRYQELVPGGDERVAAWLADLNQRLNSTRSAERRTP